jgi:hypothetical protein
MKDTNTMYSNMMSSYGQYNRLARYSGYQEMESEAIIAAALDLYSEETCAKDEHGNVIKIESENSQIKSVLTELFVDVLNIEFDSTTWIRNLCKYGDQFLMIDHHPDYGVLGVVPLPVNEIEIEHGYDKENPLQHRFRWVTQGNRSIDKAFILHFRMPGNDQFFPYGSSVIEPARRVWRQLILMEDAVMVYRMVRSPERRVFYIGIGNVPPQDVPAFMEKAKTQLKRNQITDGQGRVDLRMNPMNTLEDYFVPTRGEGDGTRIETLPGGQFTGDIEDLQYIQSKLFAALKVPKAYLGYEGDLGNKSTLSQMDVRFARTIHKIQRVFIQELNKLAIIHLYSLGYRGEDLLNFQIRMASPSTIAELQNLELWRTKFEVASMAQQGAFDRHFVYKNLFKLNNQEIEGIQEGKRKDQLEDMALQQIQLPSMENAGEEQVAATADAQAGAMPPDASQVGAGMMQPPEAGLPPPPGAGGGPALDTDGKDPYKQVAAPNSVVNPGHSNNHNPNKTPDLHKVALGTKKTGMDPDRNYSELMRSIRAPFGESTEDKMYEKKILQLRKFVEDLEFIPQLNVKNTNKLLSEENQEDEDTEEEMSLAHIIDYNTKGKKIL